MRVTLFHLDFRSNNGSCVSRPTVVPLGEHYMVKQVEFKNQG